MLDIGSGTGLIALQLAQRTEGATIVEAVEIDPAACETARRNFEASLWRDRLVLHEASVQEFAMIISNEGRFGHIVSNPPYFVDSLASPDASRNVARHTHTLSYEDLMRCCFGLMKPSGRISLIVPAGACAEKMIEAAGAYGLVVSRRMEVHSTPRSGPKRVLMEFLRREFAGVGVVETGPEEAAGGGATIAPEVSSLVIEDAGPGTFSAEYRALTRDFYLYF
jgi:tRNA1Val (adenine37-N6)-methyltransferase